MNKINRKINSMVADKSIFNDELKDFIILSEPDNENWYRKFITLNDGDITKIVSNFNIFEKLEDVESRTDHRFIEEFNKIFLYDLMNRIYRRGVVFKQILGKLHMDDFDYHVDFINDYLKYQKSVISTEYYDKLPTTEKIKIFKSFIRGKYNLKIYFLGYRILTFGNTDEEQISYDFSLKTQFD